MFNKTLIILTFLIASFFFGKWVYQVWPRYEIKTEWIKVEVGDSVKIPTSTIEYLCSDEIDVDYNAYNNSKYFYNGCYNYSHEVKENGDFVYRCDDIDASIGHCLIKTKVKIN